MESGAFIDETGGAILAGGVDPVPWWSFTKTVLAIAALRLVEIGSLTLDAPIDGARYDLRQLLRHEAGLPDYGPSRSYRDAVAAGGTPWPVDQLLAEVEADRLRYEPGTGWAYSNIGYLLVAQSIERVSGMTLAEALRRLVFAPGGLASARLAMTPADLADVRMGGAGEYHPGWVYHGLVVGTAQDAARLLRTLMSNGLIGRDMRAAMLEGRPLPEHRSAIHPDPAYGLGLMLSATDPLEHPLGHTGEGPGSRIAVYARGRKAAAVWTAAASERIAETEVFRFLA